ncbi:MAG: hypothetical protein LBK77_02765 [Spirochaetaceae bacterium]|jgi:hypothetical protein|nr:hypothetical protein [Spirochaetaceae bacterium]
MADFEELTAVSAMAYHTSMLRMGTETAKVLKNIPEFARFRRFNPEPGTVFALSLSLSYTHRHLGLKKFAQKTPFSRGRGCAQTAQEGTNEGL